MCTVTYIPPENGSGFILTSNRDERVQRETLPPTRHGDKGSALWFPQDRHSGGSWIAINETGRVCCLLNGAFVPHEKLPHHKLSRGRILMEMASVNDEVVDYFQNRDLKSVEPFTIVTIEHENGTVSHFSESIWDGSRKHFRELNIEQPYIWSSVTLYGEDHRAIRREWFQKFYKQNLSEITPEKVYSFHTGTHSDNPALNVIMLREGGLKTVSITQVTLEKERMVMKYSDLIGNTQHNIVV